MHNSKERHNHTEMLSVEEALSRIIRHFKPLEEETKPLLQVLGQVLADNITSSVDIPPLPNSGMDGYAVRYKDTIGASDHSPRFLKVIGTLAAGQLPQQNINVGESIRIMTGAPLPEGGDSVVPFEDTDESDRKQSGMTMEEIGIYLETPVNHHVRPAGGDVKNGETVLTKGISLRPSELGVLASLGLSEVKVHRRPVVAVLATGDELLTPGETYRPGKIYDSNTFTSGSAIFKYGGIPKLLGIAKDDIQDMENKLKMGLDSDLLITSAGVSKGDYDIVKDVLSTQGKIDFWSVRMRPAKPLAFGLLRGPNGRQIPHLGLPGNPVSAMVAFETFARPAILTMLGKSKLRKPTIQAVLEGPIYNYDGRRVYARVTVARRNGVYYATPVKEQGSNVLTSMVKANGLAICPESVTVKQSSETVEILMLDWNEEVEI